MKRLLLNVCCAPCSTHVIETLKQDYKLTLYFYNPNIEPEEEYKKRLEETKRYAKEKDIPLIIEDYENKRWHDAIKGHEQDKEGGERCTICFKVKLEKTAGFAEKEGYDIFTTTLSVSPYKDARLINKIGKDLKKKFKVKFLESDFKKKDGYLKSIRLSRQHNLYRQDYCGCLYSKREIESKKTMIYKDNDLIKN